MSLEELLKERIRESGAINVAEFMEAALCHPEYGYYMSRDPLGVAGDFTTAPEVSQVFGEIIGAWVAEKWLAQGSPAEIILVEPGGGRGTLMSDILRATKNVKGFHEALSVVMVEVSPVLKQKQWKSLAGKHPRIEWRENLDDLSELPLFLVANEFFDALPIRQFVGDVERKIGLDEGGKLCFVPAILEVEKSRSREVEKQEKTYTPNSELNTLSQEIKETCEPALEIVRKISRHIVNFGGAALIIDYGYAGGSRGDTLQAVKNHKYSPVLEDVGNADITAHVDFSALVRAAQEAGAKASEIMRQGAFLMRNGAGERTIDLCRLVEGEGQQKLIAGLRRLADPQEMGELFKVLAITNG